MQTQSNPFPANPALILRIQDALMDIVLTDVSLLSMSIVAYRKDLPKLCAQILFNESKTNRNKVISLIGKQTLTDIEEYFQEETENDIPPQLFTTPGYRPESDCGNWV